MWSQNFGTQKEIFTPNQYIWNVTNKSLYVFKWVLWSRSYIEIQLLNCSKHVKGAIEIYVKAVKLQGDLWRSKRRDLLFDVNSVVHFPNVVTLYQNTYDVCFSNVYHNIGHRTGNRHLIQEPAMKDSSTRFFTKRYDTAANKNLHVGSALFSPGEISLFIRAEKYQAHIYCESLILCSKK